MKFTTVSALVLAVFLGQTEASKVTLDSDCPDDNNKLRSVLRALADAPASGSSSGTNGVMCVSCGGSGKHHGSHDTKKIAKAAADAAKKAVQNFAHERIRPDLFL